MRSPHARRAIAVGETARFRGDSAPGSNFVQLVFNVVLATSNNLFVSIAAETKCLPLSFKKGHFVGDVIDD